MLLLLVAVCLAAWFVPREGVWPFCSRLYTNATFLTMNRENTIVDAVVSECGQITYVGERDTAQRMAGWFTRTVDLQGGVVLPGFIDSHSHFPLAGLSEVVLDLSPPPGGHVDSLPVLYQRLKDHIQSDQGSGWVFGFNYDNTLFAEGRHPDRYALDAVSAERPIFLRHSSGHMGVANSYGLALLGLLGDPSVAGNPLIRKYPGTFEPDGLLLESAAPNLRRFIQALSALEQWRFFRAGIQQYASAGFTTVQAGGVDSRTAKLFHRLSGSRLLPLRIVVWPNEAAVFNIPDATANTDSTEYFTLGPVKIYGDGSPQGYTAYLSEPYYQNLTEEDEYRGHPVKTDQQWKALLDSARLRGLSLAIHTNGDAAIDDVLAALDEQVNKSRDFLQQTRVILVHAQTMRLDQVKKAARLGIETSFFVSHTFFWGDWHRSTALGPTRAEAISPLGWAREHQLRFTLHTDAPVTPPSALFLLWSATERLTRSGHLLGAEQRISRLDGLRALTIDAALQADLGRHRGSLETGKAADMVVLSEDPLKAADLRSVEVVRTIVGGRTVFQREVTTPP
ncbi:MAG: amidohydrolase [Gammaproteobacteria bacterium]|nr:amidohydrolase [Gammaproteobacteria bacterium]